jgi:hypothetical protein
VARPATSGSTSSGRPTSAPTPASFWAPAACSPAATPPTARASSRTSTSTTPTSTSPAASRGWYNAAKVFLQKKDAGSYENAGHGLLHGALIAADLNSADSVNAKLLRFAREDYYYASMATSHYNNHNVFATDVVNSVPTVMMEMLAATQPGTLELLPALPKTLKKGTISGLLGKGQFTINTLTWDTDAHKVRVTLTSGIDQNLTLIQRAGITAITADGATVQASHWAASPASWSCRRAGPSPSS